MLWRPKRHSKPIGTTDIGSLNLITLSSYGCKFSDVPASAVSRRSSTMRLSINLINATVSRESENCVCDWNSCPVFNRSRLRFMAVGMSIFEFFDLGFKDVDGCAGGGLVRAFDGRPLAGREALTVDAQFDPEDTAMVGAEAFDDGVLRRRQPDRLQALLQRRLVIGRGKVLRVDLG